MSASAAQCKNVDNDNRPTSDASSDSGEYTVDYILTEKKTLRGTRYLIKWQGYPEEESTWQGLNDFTRGKDEILARWEDDKIRISQGFAVPFDLDNFAKRKSIYEKSKKLSDSKVEKSQISQRKDRAAPRKRATNLMFITTDEDSDASVENAQNYVLKDSSSGAVFGGTGVTTTNDRSAIFATMISEPDFGEHREEHSLSENENPVNRAEPLLRTTGRVEDEAAITAVLPQHTVTSIESRPNPTRSRQSSTSHEGSRITTHPQKENDWGQKVFITSCEDEPRRRKQKAMETSRIYTPSHRQAIAKKYEDGRAPNPADLNLQNPSEMVTRPPTHKARDASSILTSTMPDMPEAIPGHCEEQITEPQLTPISPSAHSIPLVCNYIFSRRICPEGDGKCRFQHSGEQTLSVAAQELHQQAREHEAGSDRWPKFDDPVIVCAYENRGSGSCFRATACAYAHWKPVHSAWHYHNHQILKKRTCRYWAQGHCRRTDEDCHHAHQMLGDVVAPVAPADIRTMTCPFWFDATYKNGPRCRKPDGDCKFAHEIKRMIARKPGDSGGAIQMDPEILRIASATIGKKGSENPAHSESPLERMDHHKSRLAQAKEVSTTGAIMQNLSLQSPKNLAASPKIDSNLMAARNEDARSSFSFTIDIGKVLIKAAFHGLTPQIQSLLIKHVHANGQHVQPYVSPWLDIERFTFPLYSNRIAYGKLISVDNEIEIAELADHLAHESCGLIFQVQDMIIILFPSRGDVEKQDAAIPDQLIGYEIRTCVDSVEKQGDAMDDLEVNNGSALKLWFQNLFDMDPDELFDWPTQPHRVGRNVFLMLGDGREAEIEVLSRLLQLLDATVYTPGAAGSWTEFKTKNEGVVVFDDRVIKYNTVPYLSHLLLCRYNFFQLNKHIPTGNLCLTRLFKTGHTIFLTDEVLIQEPHKVIEIIAHVKEKNSGKAPGQISRRIFTRPSVIDWLLQLAEDDIEDHRAGNISRAALWEEMVQLVPFNSPTEDLEFTDYVIYEPFWLENHARHFDEDADAASKALLNAFNLTLNHYREHSRNWIVLHPNNQSAAKRAEKLATEYCSMRFMTVDDFQTKIIARS